MTTNTPLGEQHPGWWDLRRRIDRASVSRRSFLRGAAAAAAGFAASPLLRTAPSLGKVSPVTPGLGLPDLAGWHSSTKIKHVVILCQENRSFDHYFGKFAGGQLGSPGNRPEVFDPNATYAASTGTKYKPFHIDYFCDFDPDHYWDASHAKWNGGLMDGWVKAEGDEPFAVGYYDEPDHIYHVQLADAFTLADNYFCSQIGPTLPNRLYLWTGTSGWKHMDPSDKNSLPYVNPPVTEVPPTLDWVTMADVLEDAKLPWACYAVADGNVPSPIGAFNPLIFFKSIQSSPTKLVKSLLPFEAFEASVLAGQLPAVSWIITEAAVSEHPPAPPDLGQLLAARVTRLLMESTAWESTALFINYDEGGGYFDHVAPPIYEDVPAGLPDAAVAVGPAFRVPMTVVSPYAKPGFIFKEPADHTSVLKFIEQNFNVSTPEIDPARRANLSDMMGAFDFTQQPQRPTLPAIEDLFQLVNETVLTSDVHRGVVECTTTIPRWLPPLLGQKPLIPYPPPPPA